MDADGRRSWLFDPTGSGDLVRAHRPADGGAATCVVSDALWGDVLALVRWAHATVGAPADLRPGTAWRTAVASAALLRRLPALCDELGEGWPASPGEFPGDLPAARQVDVPVDVMADVPAEYPARSRLSRAADRLAARLRSPGDGTPLSALATDVDALGAAAVALLAEEADWAAPS